MKLCLKNLCVIVVVAYFMCDSTVLLTGCISDSTTDRMHKWLYYWPTLCCGSSTDLLFVWYCSTDLHFVWYCSTDLLSVWYCSTGHGGSRGVQRNEGAVHEEGGRVPTRVLRHWPPQLSEHTELPHTDPEGQGQVRGQSSVRKKIVHNTIFFMQILKVKDR